MNLFRSEEHVRNWSGFKEGTDEAILSVADLMAVFRTPRHSEKFSGNYVSSAPKYAPLFFEKVKEVTGNASFWNPST
jgi:hypothetical protein